MTVRHAIFPVAGLGTRFLPATKALPKEMLPVVDKPLVQYAVEEAYAAGVREMIFVTSRHKRAIEDHFDRTFELEDALERSGKAALLDAIRAVKPDDMPPIPPVTQALLLANVAIFFLGLLLGPGLLSSFALWPIGSGSFWPWQVVTYSFLHGDFNHLFFNMPMSPQPTMSSTGLLKRVGRSVTADIRAPGHVGRVRAATRQAGKIAGRV